MLLFVDWLGRGIRELVAELARSADNTGRHAAMVQQERVVGPVRQADLGLPSVNLARVHRASLQRELHIEAVSAELAQRCVLSKCVLSWFFLEYLHRVSDENERGWSEGELAQQQLDPGSGGGYPEYEHVMIQSQSRRGTLGSSYRIGRLVDQLSQAAWGQVFHGIGLFVDCGLVLPQAGGAQLDLPASTGTDPFELYLERDIWILDHRLGDAYRKGCFRAADRADLQAIIWDLHRRVQNDLERGRLPNAVTSWQIRTALEERSDAERLLREALTEYRIASAHWKYARRHLKWYRGVSWEPLKSLERSRPRPPAQPQVTISGAGVPRGEVGGGVTSGTLGPAAGALESDLLEVTMHQLDTACAASVAATVCARITTEAVAKVLLLADSVPRVPPSQSPTWTTGWWVVTIDVAAPRECDHGVAVLMPESGCSGGRKVHQWKYQYQQHAQRCDGGGSFGEHVIKLVGDGREEESE